MSTTVDAVAELLELDDARRAALVDELPRLPVLLADPRAAVDDVLDELFRCGRELDRARNTPPPFCSPLPHTCPDDAPAPLRRRIVAALCRIAVLESDYPDAEARGVGRRIRALVALAAGRRGRRFARLITTAGVWNDSELLDVLLAGRHAIRHELTRETEPARRAVLELALSILDDARLSPAVEYAPDTDENEPSRPKCAPRRARRRAGPLLCRPRLSHARRSDDPYPFP